MFTTSPRLFISYSRRDDDFVSMLEASLTKKGFKVFRDTSDISPGDNFVTTITREIREATGLIAVISASYATSPWGKAELYTALASRKLTIPLVLSEDALKALDEPLRRLLRDTNYVVAQPGTKDPLLLDGFANLLAKARARHRREIARRIAYIAIPVLMSVGAVAWGAANLNWLDQARRRERVVDETVNAKRVIQHDRIRQLASSIAGDHQAVGELLFLTQDPAISDSARFNALSMESELRKGQKVYRWYPRDLDIDRADLDGITLANVSFLGGHWTHVQIKDAIFSGAFWSKEKGTTLSGARFTNVGFYGSEFEDITAVDVAFINSKFRGSIVDTTNFSKVRFATEQAPTEGTPIITPYFTSFEGSTLISRRNPPAPGVLDLTAVGDDVVFDNVIFRNCRLEGWFRPEWFRHSSFEGCALPDSLSRDKLVAAGNTVVD